ncbi:MAG TPA: UvrB/UvrC motif-containing protein, partial [Gemmatimonadales bacterium]|nr:UvrB/UvrC motif-containing protein [Gemmatimonadales bacterium]
GKAILYADRVTGSMQRALDEMDRRRALQQSYNEAHGITPASIIKSLEETRLTTRVADARTEKPAARREVAAPDLHDPGQREAYIRALEAQMREAAANLEFELAALLRDQITDLRAAGAPSVRRGAAHGAAGAGA